MSNLPAEQKVGAFKEGEVSVGNDNRVNAGTSSRRPDSQVCEKQVSPDGWHWYRCNKPAKSLIKLTGVDQDWSPRCGIHARHAKKSPRFEVKPA